MQFNFPNEHHCNFRASSYKCKDLNIKKTNVVLMNELIQNADCAPTLRSNTVEES